MEGSESAIDIKSKTISFQFKAKLLLDVLIISYFVVFISWLNQRFIKICFNLNGEKYNSIMYFCKVYKKCKNYLCMFINTVFKGVL